MIRIVLLLALLCSAPAFGQQAVERSARTVRIDGTTYALHSVARKETLFSIAKAYGVTVEAIEKANPYLEERLAVGATLLIPQKEAAVEFVPEQKVYPPVEPKAIETDSAKYEVWPTPAPMPVMQIDRIRLKSAPGTGFEVALLLPFGGQTNEGNFVEFLCGALLAVDALKDEGTTVRLNVRSTEASVEKAGQLIASGALFRADAIIGPVYDKPFAEVGSWASMYQQVPVVSPLGGSGSIDNPYIICAAPSEATKYDALRTALADPTAKVSYIDCGADNDPEWAEAAAGRLPVGAATLAYRGKETNVNELTALLAREGRNVVVLPTSNETLVEAILSRLSSINAAGRYDITVVGTPRWARFASMNLDLFFKLNASYTTSYHADRTDPRAAAFFKKYIETFGAVPSPYAMRGYDVVVWVGRTLEKSGERFLYDLPAVEGAVLQTPYRFAQLNGQGSKFENVRWAWVTYRPNYTIEVR